MEKTLSCSNTANKEQRASSAMDAHLLSPYFVLAALSEELDIECGIRYLREIAHAAGLTTEDAIICYARDPGKSICCKEFATAIPHQRVSRKRNEAGESVVENVHARWIQPREPWEEFYTSSSRRSPNTTYH